MRTETIIKHLYTFDELSDEAKEKARGWWRRCECEDPSWFGENQDSLNAFCKIFPVHAKDWEYDQWRGDISPRFTGEDAIGELTGPRLAAYLCNHYASVLWEPKKYCKGPWYASDAKIRMSRISVVETCCPFTGYCFDDTLLDEIRSFIKKPDDRDFEELLADCLWKWVYACRDDLASAMEDENVDESILCNGYEFTEDGESA